MIKAKPISDISQIKGTITPPAQLIGRVTQTISEIKGTIYRDIPEIKGTISEDVKRESYYEVSNEYGTTIIIGD